MNSILHSAKIVTPFETIENGAVILSNNGKISYVGHSSSLPKVDGEKIDLQGKTLLPGLIDIHVHGGHGVTFGDEDGNPDKLSEYAQWAAGQGVTGFLTSVSAPNPEELNIILRNYAPVFEAGLPGAEGLGFHLEGPFLSVEKKGAFNPDWLRTPDLEEIQSYLENGQGWIRQMTIAPDLPNASEAAQMLRENNVVAALGHTNCNYETASQALKGDFNHVTHTCNAMRGLNHREPGVLGAVLASDEVTAELITDLVHVHPAVIEIIIRALGVERVVVITDAMAGAGLGDGVYQLVGHKTIVKDGKATLENGTIAGSASTMIRNVRNLVETVGVSLPDAVQMASLNPARVIGAADRLGSIEEGKDANLTVIDDDFNVLRTFVKGKTVFLND